MIELLGMTQSTQFEFHDEGEHLRASFVHGLKHLPIRIRLRRG